MTTTPPKRRRLPSWLLVILPALLVILLALPVFSLILSTTPRTLIEGLRHPTTAPALWLSLATTTCSLGFIISLGTPLAYWLSRRSGAWVRLVETVVQLPMVLPPAVAGLALLLTFGRLGVLGPTLKALGLDLVFTTTAVVLAQIFVAAPLYVRAAMAAFSALDPTLLVVARTLGASPVRVFFRIAVPLARPGLVAGAALSWARALGEFGATLMFAGSFPGQTQTMPLAIYAAFEGDRIAAQALSLILVVVAVLILVTMPRPPKRLP